MNRGRERIVAEFIFRDDAAGYWIDVIVDRSPYGELGPFETSEQRQKAHKDMQEMLYKRGSVDAPLQ